MRSLQTNFPTSQVGRSIDYEAMKRHGYQDQGIVIVNVNDPRLSWDQRELIKQVGQKLYGG